MKQIPFAMSKRGPAGKWVMLTAYDALMASQAESGGADILLVGDSLGGAVLGCNGVSQVGLADMVHHGRAVLRGRRKVPVVIDMPFGTCATEPMAFASADKLMETGCEAVKIEGCVPGIIRKLKAKSVPVMAHLGYTPQSGEPRIVGRDKDGAARLLDESRRLEDAGAFALVLELVPREASKAVAEALRIPVIGIGSGPDVDGQVLVITDMWGESGKDFKFLQRFGEIGKAKIAAVGSFAAAVRSGAFPSDANSFHMKKE